MGTAVRVKKFNYYRGRKRLKRKRSDNGTPGRRFSSGPERVEEGCNPPVVGAKEREGEGRN